MKAENYLCCDICSETWYYQDLMIVPVPNSNFSVAICPQCNERYGAYELGNSYDNKGEPKLTKKGGCAALRTAASRIVDLEDLVEALNNFA